MRLLFIAITICTRLSTTTTSTLALVSNESENSASPTRRRLRTNLFNHSTVTLQELPSSAPSSDDPSIAPWFAPSDGAAVGEVSVLAFDEPLALTTFSPTTPMPTSQHTTSRPITSTPTSTPTTVPTESKSAPTPTTYQPTAPKSITSNLFTAAALDVNTTTVSSLSACAVPETNSCGPSKTCAEISYTGYCCSQYGYCGTSEAYCGACCVNGPCWTSKPSTSKPQTSKPTTTMPTSRKPSSTTTLKPSTAGPTIKPTSPPTTSKPTTTPTSQLSTSRPSTRPTTIKPTFRPTSSKPTLRPTTARPTTCSFTFATYDAIDADIAKLKDDITNAEDRAHFLGGIVRLAAHDFMDFNAAATPPMGADGCFNATHPNNAGLETIWSSGRPLFELHRTKYSHIGRADFWVACANAVIRQTSLDTNNDLNLRTTFRWGRIDAASCSGSGDRLPIPSRCSRVEAVFLTRMGLTWRESVALLGAHTLGRGNRDFSGHHGTWKDNNTVAQVFDKQFYRELLDNNWRMIFNDGPQDWTTGNLPNDRMMLNTDICLAYDVDAQINREIPPCTTRFTQNVPSCPMYASTSARRPALDAVVEFSNEVNGRFYAAFSGAWNKATVKGSSSLKSLTLSC